ncbi:uncharacterized protein LOC119082773 [Bradysia coprophila]|uniref:uncharacterized protein LOC119082773 n=1 Tax=Bradysia coprophila TaxID=38358 RepID=UPI00187D8390|nr:uncharacterized protein LOC119082773 [Bradysia coprophila]
MSTSRNKAVKTKSNSHKKLRKSICETAVEHNPPNRSDVEIQTLEKKKSSPDRCSKKAHRESSICKSLENIMHLKSTSGSHDALSMSKTDISIVYGMYKNLIDKHNINNDIHVGNYQTLLNEFHKLQSQLYEQGLCNKSLMSTLVSQQRMDRRMRRKGMNKGNKILIMKMNEIISVMYKLQSSFESLDHKTLALDSKIEESVTAVHQEIIQSKKKKFVFCSCM